MLNLIFFLICLSASIIGAVCGIGGGVIIKPMLDAFGILSVETISFLSGCTVLSMSAYSVISGRRESHIKPKIGLPLGIGAAVGGLIGKWMFSYLSSLYTDKDKVGAIQAVCLLIVTIGTLVYTIYKQRIKTYRLQNIFFCVFIGLFLGILSSFLGIGGGPINLVVLFFFFSMSTKEAVENSLYIIFYSQTASLISYIVTESIPDFSGHLLALMVTGALAGGIFGRTWNKKIDEKTVDVLFAGLTVVLILINIYNIIKFIT